MGEKALNRARENEVGDSAGGCVCPQRRAHSRYLAFRQDYVFSVRRVSLAAEQVSCATTFQMVSFPGIALGWRFVSAGGLLAVLIEKLHVESQRTMACQVDLTRHEICQFALAMILMLDGRALDGIQSPGCKTRNRAWKRMGGPAAAWVKGHETQTWLYAWTVTGFMRVRLKHIALEATRVMRLSLGDIAYVIFGKFIFVITLSHLISYWDLSFHGRLLVKRVLSCQMFGSLNRAQSHPIANLQFLPLSPSHGGDGLFRDKAKVGWIFRTGSRVKIWGTFEPSEKFPS
ncbi:hypothetical protein LguiB_018365 [Lonicera macranthoides]